MNFSHSYMEIIWKWRWPRTRSQCFYTPWLMASETLRSPIDGARSVTIFAVVLQPWRNVHVDKDHVHGLITYA